MPQTEPNTRDLERRIQALEAVVKAVAAHNLGAAQRDRITENLQATIDTIPKAEGSEITAEKLTKAVEALLHGTPSAR